MNPRALRALQVTSAPGERNGRAEGDGTRALFLAVHLLCLLHFVLCTHKYIKGKVNEKCKPTFANGCKLKRLSSIPICLGEELIIID